MARHKIIHEENLIGPPPLGDAPEPSWDLVAEKQAEEDARVATGVADKARMATMQTEIAERDKQDQILTSIQQRLGKTEVDLALQELSLGRLTGKVGSLETSANESDLFPQLEVVDDFIHAYPGAFATRLELDQGKIGFGYNQTDGHTLTVYAGTMWIHRGFNAAYAFAEDTTVDLTGSECWIYAQYDLAYTAATIEVSASAPVSDAQTYKTTLSRWELVSGVVGPPNTTIYKLKELCHWGDIHFAFPGVDSAIPTIWPNGYSLEYYTDLLQLYEFESPSAATTPDDNSTILTRYDGPYHILQYLTKAQLATWLQGTIDHDSTGGAAASDIHTFILLSDTDPENYTGASHKLVRVNLGNGTDGTGLEFVAPAGIGTFWELGAATAAKAWGDVIGNSATNIVISLASSWLSADNGAGYTLDWANRLLDGADWSVNAGTIFKVLDTTDTTSKTTGAALISGGLATLLDIWSGATIHADTGLKIETGDNWWSNAGFNAEPAGYVRIFPSGENDVTIGGDQNVFLMPAGNLDLDPTGELQINDVAGVTVANWITKGIMTGTITEKSVALLDPETDYVLVRTI